MKKNLVVIVLFIIAFAANVTAQGGFQRRTVEERLKTVHEKIDSAFKPTVTIMANIDSVFKNYYIAQDKYREDMMASGNTDRDAMRSEMTKMAGERDEKLKKLLSEEQMKIWKDTIEPSMRPQRGQRPPGQ